MFKHLFMLCLFLAAILSTSTPAHASALTVNAVNCAIFQYSGSTGYYTCTGQVSGGTGSYISYTWFINSTLGSFTRTTFTPNLKPQTCSTNYGETLTVRLTVQDSAGNSASAWSAPMYCGSL